LTDDVESSRADYKHWASVKIGETIGVETESTQKLAL